MDYVLFAYLKKNICPSVCPSPFGLILSYTANIPWTPIFLPIPYALHGLPGVRKQFQNLMSHFLESGLG